MAWSSNSSSARSGMSALHLCPQILDGPKLQLFNGPLAAAQRLGDLPDALLLHEAHMNHAELCFRKPIHQLEQHGLSLDFVRRRQAGFGRRLTRLAAGALPV